MSFSFLTRVLVSAGAPLVLLGTLSAPALANSLSEPAVLLERALLLERNVRVLNAGETTGGIPAGMVLVEGGRFTMGLAPKEMDNLVESLGIEDGENVGAMGIISGWYPDHQVEVDDLLVDKYEFTNLQYLKYLEARRQEPTKDLLDWHWYSYNTKGEKVPGLTEAKHNLPIRAITGKDADRASRWVGKRLPTEPEWEYFARHGLKKDQYYPWKNDGLKGWDKVKCSNSATSMTKEGPETAPGGSFPEDQNLGIFDLCGNVTEWTSTPFLPHPGWKPYEVKVRKKKRSFRSEFSAEHWTIRGGNCRGTEISNVLISRQPWHPNSLAEYVGFRCVMSALPGLDVLRHAEARNLTLMQRDLKGMLDYRPEAMAAQLIHETDAEGRVQSADHLAFTRIKESLFKSESVFNNASKEEPVAIGIFTTSKPLAYPDLPAGSYTVYFKGEGLSKAQKEAQRAVEEAKKAADEAEKERKKEERKNKGRSKRDKKAEEEAQKKAEEEAAAKAEQEAEEGEQEESAEEEPQSKQLTLLDLPTDQDILLIKSEAEEIVAWLPAERTKSKGHPTRFAYVKGGGKANRTTAAAMSTAGAKSTGTKTTGAKAADQAANDLAWFQFPIKIGSGSNQPQVNLKLEFEPGSFEPVSMPVDEKPARGSRSSRKK